MFHVGQKVVCVDGRPTDKEGACELVRGAIYTIRWCGMWSLPPWFPKPKLGVRLVGVDRGPDPWRPDLDAAFDMPFNAARFRPVVERKTDIGFAYEILRKATKQRPVRSPVVSISE